MIAARWYSTLNCLASTRDLALSRDSAALKSGPPRFARPLWLAFLATCLSPLVGSFTPTPCAWGIYQTPAVPVAAAPAPSRPSPPAVRPLRLKVLVLNYDPFIDGQRLHQVLNFHDPRQLARQFLEDVRKSTGGLLEFEISEWRDLDEIYARDTGEIYRVEEYVKMRRTNSGWPARIVADYPRIFREQKVVDLINDGSIDEVWIFGDHYFGIWEASMAGPGAFFINGGVYPEVPAVRPFAFYGFNYERGVAEMLHNTAHRIEATMNRTYGEWNLAEPRNNWELFSANAQQSNGVAGVGTCHWPANAESDYDYANRREVLSHADDFLNYPHLTGEKRLVSAKTWSADGVDPHRDYMNWYLERLPKASGVNPDGKLNNWLPYIFDFQNYDRGGKPLPNTVTFVKAQLQKQQLAVMLAFSTAAGCDPALIQPEWITLRLNDIAIPAARVHLLDSASGTYRTASFVFPLPANPQWESARLAFQGEQLRDLNQVPFAEALWKLSVREEQVRAVPRRAGRETPYEVAQWIMAQGGKLSLKGSNEWIADPADLPTKKKLNVERIFWWHENHPDRLVNAAELAALEVFAEVRELELRGHSLGDAGCEWIAGLKNLRVLNLHACGVTDEGLTQLAQLKQLERLDVGYSHGRITDAGAAALIALRNLQDLNIYNSAITDRTLQDTLSRLPKLRRVEIIGTAVTDAALEAWRQAHPECQLIK